MRNSISKEVTVTSNAKKKVVRSGRLASIIRRAHELNKTAYMLEPEILSVKKEIAERAKDYMDGEKGSVLFRTGAISLKVSPRHEAVIPEENIKELKKILGARFGRLVKIKKTYLCSKELLDDESAERLITLKEFSPRFTWREHAGQE